MSGFPTLKPAFIIKARLEPPRSIGNLSTGGKGSYVNCISSSIHSEPGFCSPPLSATQVVGGDWTTITPDEKQLRLDVRSVVVTEDGAHVSIAFAGIVKIDDAIAAILQGKEEAKSTEFGSVVTNNSFKTGDERWMWMQDEYFVGAGRFVVDKEGLGVEYNVAQVMAGVQES